MISHNLLLMDKQLLNDYNNKMEIKDWMSTREAAVYLGVSKPQIFRLIQNGHLIAHKEDSAPVPYYKVQKDALDAYKALPKNKGGRPRTKGCAH